MNILWAPEAEQDRLHIWTHVAAENPVAARQLDRLFAKAAASLADFSQRGKPGRIHGTRELFPMKTTGWCMKFMAKPSGYWPWCMPPGNGRCLPLQATIKTLPFPRMPAHA